MGPLPVNNLSQMCFRTVKLNHQFFRHRFDYQNLVYRHHLLRVDNTMPSKAEFTEKLHNSQRDLAKLFPDIQAEVTKSREKTYPI